MNSSRAPDETKLFQPQELHMNRLLVLLIWLLPLLILMILGENGVGISPFVVGLILLLLFLAAGVAMGGGGCSEEEEKKEESVLDDRIRSLAIDLRPFLAVKGWKAAGDVVQFEGSLLSSPPEALEGISGKLASSNLRAILTEGEQNQVRVTLVPASAEESAAKEPNWWLHGILFLLTFATTTWAGALHQGVNILQNPASFAVGLPYSIGLLLILGAHELGHYFAARRHRIQVTPPYFIPAPFALGTSAPLSA
jgi:hypothetical protein